MCIALSRMLSPCYIFIGWKGHISREYCKPEPSTLQPLGGIVRNFELELAFCNEEKGGHSCQPLLKT
jgi:hypothetical protein